MPDAAVLRRKGFAQVLADACASSLPVRPRDSYIECRQRDADMDIARDNHFDLRMRVGDKWVDSSQRQTMPVVNPATGEVIARVFIATADHAQASRAQRARAAQTPTARVG
jgi:hypothetical protein